MAKPTTIQLLAELVKRGETTKGDMLGSTNLVLRNVAPHNKSVVLIINTNVVNQIKAITRDTSEPNNK